MSRRASLVDVLQPNYTGINRWWSYEEGAIPGVGRYMINLWQQNLIVQADDMDVHYRGIDLAFRRTYNSYSNHDYAGSDGSVAIGQYGNGWTNTFDAHMTQNSAGGMSIYDVDGARYDYSYDAGGNLQPPVGLEGTSLVTYDGGSFYWTKKSGTQYTFYAPYYDGTMAAYSGRIYRISGRNRNNYIQFSYGWDNADASTNAHLNTIYATTDSGMTSTLGFEDFNGRRLCWYIELPDNATRVWYGYDDAGNLTVVRHEPRTAGDPSRYEGYGGYRQWMWVTSPRWNSSGGAVDGGNVSFHFVNLNSSQVDGINFVGVMNFAPADGTGTYLQNGPSTTEATYNYASISTAGNGVTILSDTDGHAYQQNMDPLGRPTNRYAWTGTQSLATAEGWDAHNNRTADVDARGNETDYAYDAIGNTIAVAQPAPAPGAFRPTSLYSYDVDANGVVFDNVTAYCDPVATHQLSADWQVSAPAGDSLCPQSTLATRYTYNHPSYEPNGELIASTSPATAAAPSGYQRTFNYDLGPQGGSDYGLPTGVVGAAIAQNDASTPVRQPRQTFWYDSNGNLVCYGSGNGQWLLAYDSLGRQISTADPDDSSSGAGTCGKTGGQPNWNTTTRTTYFPDGAVASKQSASQVANGVSTSFAYDLDGNEVSETHHYGCAAVSGCTAGVTQKFYDGADRLIEVTLPYDAYDIQGYPMMTRYIYDLSQGGTTPYQGLGLRGYGNLVKTQSCSPER